MSKKYDRLAWLKLIKVDPTLRPSVFKTAFEITQYVDVETGEFFAAPKTIAEGGDWSDGIAMSTSMVEENMGLLEAAGFMECIERGKRGRSHSSRFRIILKSRPAGISKSRPAGISKPPKIPVLTPENPGFTPVKSRPGGMNHREPYLTIEQSAPPARSSVRVDRLPVTEMQSDDDSEMIFDPYANAPRPDESWYEEVRLREQAQFREIIAQMNGSTTLQSSL